MPIGSRMMLLRPLPATLPVTFVLPLATNVDDEALEGELNKAIAYRMRIAPKFAVLLMC